MRVYNYCSKLLASRWFFFFVVALFVLQALQLALTSATPMAFDEGFHFRVIQFFSHAWHPFITSQPPDTYAQGAIVHNPSFLYYYVLSFPYRLTALFTDNTATQIMVLRGLNIALAAGTLVVLRQLFGLLKVKARFGHLALFLLALTPMFTALSAQINYDNAVMLLAAAVGYYAVKLRAEDRLQARTLALLIGLALVGCVVKFSFLPLLCAVVIYSAWLVAARWRQNGRMVWAGLAASAQSLARWQKAGLITLLCAGIGLCASFYGYALVRYHTPVPQCDQILSVQACRHYYAWNRNYEAYQNKQDGPRMNVVSYTLEWGRAMYYHLFAELVPWGGIIAVAPPFYVVVMSLTALAAFCAVLQAGRLVRRYPGLAVLGFFSLVYLCFLWSRNYSEYLRLGEWVAVQGRYLMPVIAFVYVTLILGVALAVKRRGGLRHVSALALALLLGVFVYFGGAAQYLASITPYHNWSTPNHDQGILAPGSHAGYPAVLAEPHAGLAFAAAVSAAGGVWWLVKAARKRKLGTGELYSVEPE